MTGPAEDQPLVIDQFLAATYKFPKVLDPGRRLPREQRGWLEQEMIGFRVSLRKAERFFLDDAFTEMATRVSASMTPEKMHACLQAAALPYETTWLEFDLHAKVRTSISMSTKPDRPVDALTPQRAGILFKRDPRRPTAWSMQMVHALGIKEDGQKAKLDDELVMASPAVYLFDAMDGPALHKGWTSGHRPFALYHPDSSGLDPREIEDLGRGLRSYPWGFGLEPGLRVTIRETHAKLGDILDDAARRVPDSLLKHCQVSTSDYYRATLKGIELRKVGAGTREEALTAWILDYTYNLSENSGMLRWALVVLSMLNDVPTVTGHVKPQGTQRVGLGRRPLMDYHRVSLKLPKTRPQRWVERKLSLADARRRKAHQVRSHWRTYLTEGACRRVSPADDGHVWEYDHENGYRLCCTCESFGRLIPEHERGDPSLGWVRKDYVLEKAKQT